jgi:ribonuclease HI
MTRTGKLHPPDSARLFSDSDASSNPPSGVHVANVDGASRGNPGPASYAVVIRDASGKIILELAKKLGRETNNVAEYYALLTALDYAVAHGISALRLRSDSELLVRQMQGRYKVKSPDLKPLFERASKLARQIPYFAIEHVRRELNRDADALANHALDSGDFSSAAGNSANSSHASAPAAGTSAPKLSPSPVAGSDGHSSTVSKKPHSDSPARRRVRARFVRGVFVPAEPVDLAEGSTVLVEFLPVDSQPGDDK